MAIKGINCNNLDWFRSYLSEKKQKTEILKIIILVKFNFLSWLSVKIGFYVSSPTLFLIYEYINYLAVYINKIADNIQRNTYLFADDPTILIKQVVWKN